jgi:GxxExxY protein
MPIQVGVELCRMDDDEFRACAYEVTRHAFDVQKELGRLFRESIYRNEIAYRVANAHREVPINVCFEDFSKTYHIDLLVGSGAAFELKAVEALTERHKRQLLQYLFLADLPHGKLINLRSERVQHEFINNTLMKSDRTSFDVDDTRWQELQSARLKESMIAVLRDWGTGFDIALYEEVAAFFCGQPPDAQEGVEIRLGGRTVGVQPFRIVAPSAALRISTLPANRLAEYQTHLKNCLDHTNLHSIQWINMTRHTVLFKTIRNE